MIAINLTELINKYDDNLLDNLRGFGKGNEYLKFWVPGTSSYQSFVNLIDALVEANNFEATIIFKEAFSEKKLLEQISLFLINVNDKDKKILEESFTFQILINLKNYQEYKSKKKTNINKFKNVEIDKTKKIKKYRSKELISKLYKENLNLIKTNNYFKKDRFVEDNQFIEIIENIELRFVINDTKLIKLSHNCENKSDLFLLTEIFFDICINKNIQEAADHATIYLEEKIRLAKPGLIKPGIILPEQCGIYFTLINEAIRKVFNKYKNNNKIKFDVNKNYFETSESWIKLSKENKVNKINSILIEIIKNNKELNNDSVAVNVIENNFRVFLTVDSNFKRLQNNKNLLLEIEIKLKKIENTLEVFVDEILDKNKLRLKNSPQNIVT